MKDPQQHLEELQALGFSSVEDYEDHQRVMRNMRDLTAQQLEDPAQYIASQNGGNHAEDSRNI